MKKEYKTINIEVFKTTDDLPTCTNNPENNCQFLKTSNFGHRFICGHQDRVLERYSEFGFLKPDQNCPLWSSGNENT